MELAKEAAIGDIVKACRADTHYGVLDEILHHLHSIHITTILVHQIDVVTLAICKVFLGHLAYGVCLVDDVKLSHLLILAVDREIGPHNDSVHKSLVLIRYRKEDLLVLLFEL